jgi:hypothetical protein
MNVPLLNLIYAANVIVAGWISVTSLFFPRTAQATVFGGAVAYSEVIRLAGALWGAIFLLSALGLYWPRQMSLVLLVQLIYKTAWLLAAALPALLRQEPFPRAMAVFFLIWVLVLPLAAPWRVWFGNG